MLLTIRVVGTLLLFAVVGVLGWLFRDPWAGTPLHRRLRPFVGVGLGVLLWFGAGLYGPAPDGRTLPCSPYEDARDEAMDRGVPLLVDFTADWCTACRQLKREVLDHPRVVDAHDEGQFVCALVDVTREGEREQALMERYRVLSLPRIAMVAPDGEWVPGWSMSGMVAVRDVLAAVDGVAAGVEGDGGRFRRALVDQGWAWAFLLVFLAGFASSLTPCVYPLIPVTVGLFAAAGARSRLEGFGKACIYVGGIGVTYVALGMVAALFGGLVGGVLQSPFVLGAFALLFLAFGLSSGGLFAITLPGALQSRLGEVSGRGGLVPLAIAGVAAGFLAAPCVGPILGGVLVFISESRDVALGGALMGTFALGMGILFLALGTFSSLVDRMPRSGSWMETLKGVFAVVFGALAMEYASLAIPVLADARAAMLPMLLGA